MNKKERIEFLCRSLERHNHLYYIEAQPEISDREYDALLEELEALEKNASGMGRSRLAHPTRGRNPAQSF
jgi:NAD-dependent DNA ligase